MNKTASESKTLIEQLIPLLADVTEVDVVVCPPFVNVESAAAALKGSNIALGVQNMHYEQSGAYTGEIAPSMLVELGVQYVILGHSERRQFFGETDEGVNKKTRTAIEFGLKPIVCIGETLEEREAGITNEVVCKQTKLALLGLSESEAADVVLAYEPIWAIGTGVTATADDANETIAAIRASVKEAFSGDVAAKIRIQYGGSMKPGNVSELMAKPDIDGGLIGGAALKAEDFSKVVKF